MQPSFWEKQNYLEKFDAMVIGGGVVGLSAALELKNLDPHLKVGVLERGVLPSGASTKNAGFVSFGNVSRLLEYFESMSEDDTFALVERRWSGLQKLLGNLGQENLDYEPHEGYEVFLPEHEDLHGRCLDRLDDINKNLSSIMGHERVLRPADEKIQEFGFAQVSHLICNRMEAGIDPAKMILAFQVKLAEKGVIVRGGVDVKGFRHDGRLFDIYADGFRFSARRIIVAVNAFTRRLLPGIDVVPARGQVVITAPIPGLKVRGNFHHERGFYYFRNVGSRILLGGGRNLDIEGETTYEFDLTPRIQDSLETLLREMILPGIPFEIEQRWSGIMGMGPEKTPIVKEPEPGVVCAARLSGMGISLGSSVGVQAAQMLLEGGR